MLGSALVGEEAAERVLALLYEGLALPLLRRLGVDLALQILELPLDALVVLAVSGPPLGLGRGFRRPLLFDLCGQRIRVGVLGLGGRGQLPAVRRRARAPAAGGAA